MITQISILNLFGIFNYEIVFKFGGVTIITGPNGYGKSTILKCIDELSHGNLFFFIKLDFQSIKLLTSNPNENIEIIKNYDNLSLNGTEFPYEFLLARNKQGLRRNPIVRIDEDRWLDKRTGEVLDAYEYKRNYFIHSDSSTYYDFNEEQIKEYNDIIKNIKNLIGEIHFIKEQRLIKEKKSIKSEQEIINVIEDLPNKLRKRISEISSNYSAVANKLDSSYPTRLFNMDNGISEEQYKLKMLQMINKFDKLRKYDISEMQNSANVIFKEEHAKALKIYFDDFDEKYKVYEDFISQLDLLTDIINSRLSFKEIKITRENGIIVVNKEDESQKLSLSQLSSGEKQEIVMFYELIFDTEPDALLLIDEPEISLHIAWQKMFMDDLLRIVSYKGINVIIATHSPQIINNHWDIQIDLGELYGKQLDKM